MSLPPDVPFPDRSADPCPRCGRHELALTQPPHVPVMGAQPYTEIYRLGDLPMPVGVRCRACGTTWPTIEALRAGDPGTSGEIDPVDGLDPTDDPGPAGPAGPAGPTGPTAATPAASAAAGAASSSASRQAGILAISAALVALLLVVFVFLNALFVPLVVVLMAAGLVASYVRRPRR